jgi:endonuclease G
VFEADYTSLGGNSGSVVLSLDSGKALGLHFAGLFRDTNFAVGGPIVEAALRRLKTVVAVPLEAPASDPVTPPSELEGRAGYQPAFLGPDAVVPFPDFGRWKDDLAPLLSGDGAELKYTHFSVIQSASRRLPLITAVNIDGEKAFNLKREGTWKLDGRMASEHQIGNDLYRSNPIDRGHLVRRMDPGWGDERDEAVQGEADTFHYTNSAPQHEDLNQKIWLGLEDYVLGSATTRGFSACILTGPVFRDDDPRLRRQPGTEAIAIPREYWKVAAMINDDTGKLSVTGYVLSQGEMIKSLTEAAFVYGKYETYQVKLSLIEDATGLDFGDLKRFDPLAGAQESRFGEAARRITGPDTLKL